MKIGIVLDTTALLAYARIESVAVGELIAVVRDDGDVCAAPALALLDVWNQLKPPEQAMLTDLFRRDDPPVEAIPFREEQLEQVAAIAAEDGLAIAHTVAVVMAYDSTVVTYTPERYRRWLDEDHILLLE